MESISSLDLKQCYKVAQKLAHDAGEIIRAEINKEKNIATKTSKQDLVTETDKKVEAFLIEGFKSHFHDHCYIGEETTGCNLTDAPTWIIDPVDGTMNFVHQFPYSCVSIGLAVEKKIVLGVVYNPMLDKMYRAMKDNGAYCNAEKLQVSNVQNISEALIMNELGGNRSVENVEQLFTNMRKIAHMAHGIRMMGSAALNMCEVAHGHADAYYEYSLHCWDMAAGKIIVEEAGGVVIDPEGGPWDLMSRRLICASSLNLATFLSKELKHIQFPHDQ